MSKLDTQNINVLNYNENEVFVDSAKEAGHPFVKRRKNKNCLVLEGNMNYNYPKRIMRL